MTHYVCQDLRFQLKPSTRRKTLGITVDRDGSLLLHTPSGAPQGEIEAFVRAKRFWVYTKLAEKELLAEKAYPSRQFVEGEGYCYLGRVHRLKLVPEADTPLQLKNGRFLLHDARPQQARKAFVAWYRDRALERLPELAAEYTQRLGVSAAGVRLLDLSNRWASCSEKGVLNFHWKIMQLPQRLIRYVVAHEVAHLAEKHHTPKFWLNLERLMPDYAKRSGELREQGLTYLRLT